MNDYKMLVVDDEEDILSSVRRVFFDNPGIKIFTANSGIEGLKILSDNRDIDLVISDMRMPKMNGSEFLKKSRELVPDAYRMLLTGYSDINDAMSAVNEGGIDLYISKPWKKDEFKTAVGNALQHSALVKENKSMNLIIRKQNAELTELNLSLEAKVKERTRQLEDAFGLLKEKNEVLMFNFNEIILFLTNILAHYNRFISGHCKRVAEMSKKIVDSMKFTDDERRDIIYAAYFHDIGLIGISDDYINIGVDKLNANDSRIYAEHPALGQKLLSNFKNFNEVSRMIRSHHERYDGSGFPDGLSAADIPAGSRIIGVINDYDNMVFIKGLTPKNAVEIISGSQKDMYDPEIMNAFIALIDNERKFVTDPVEIGIESVKEGMYLMSDIYLKNGVLLFHKGSIINSDIMNNIVKFETMVEKGIKVRVIVN
jgi:response regulator RpfG family c-di-GMP phosphodiesterase